MKNLALLLSITAILLASCEAQDETMILPETSVEKGYPVVDTGAETFYDNTSVIISPAKESPFYGQDAHYKSNTPSYTDNVTGLMWQKDMGEKMTWSEAHEMVQSFNLAGYDDWRIPNAKELQSIVDYTRAPDVTGTAAINPLFGITSITDPDGNLQFPYFWTSTTHLDGMIPESAAAYIAFGEAQGYMHDQLMDVHGAGAQRSDPKTGDPDNYPEYYGPQGDVRYVFNYVRCVRSM